MYQQLDRVVRWQCLVLLLISLWWRAAAIHHDYHIPDHADHHQHHHCELFSIPALLFDAVELVAPLWFGQAQPLAVFAAFDHLACQPKARDPPILHST